MSLSNGQMTVTHLPAPLKPEEQKAVERYRKALLAAERGLSDVGLDRPMDPHRLIAGSGPLAQMMAEYDANLWQRAERAMQDRIRAAILRRLGEAGKDQRTVWQAALREVESVPVLTDLTALAQLASREHD